MNHLRLLTTLLFVTACSSPGHHGAIAPDTGAQVSSGEAWMQLEDMRGGRHDLSRALADDRSVALVFWQSWCAPCIHEAPGVASASKRLDGEVDFYGVVSGPDDVVDEQAVTDTARRLQLPYPQVRDRSGELARRFEVVGTPTIVVIEPSGRVSFVGHELPPAWSATEEAGR
jgi:thiol-disulfide isomerase/thioredoxin